MKEPINIYSIKLHPYWEADIFGTRRPLTKDEKFSIITNLQSYKKAHTDWKGSPCDMMDYVIFSPFKDIIIPICSDVLTLELD